MKSSVKLLAASLHGVVQMPYDGYFGEGIDTLSGAASSAHEGADEINDTLSGAASSAHEGADEINEFPPT